MVDGKLVPSLGYVRGRAPADRAFRQALEVELIPLLNKNIVVDRLVLEDPVIALEVDKQGKPNWDMTPAGGAAAPAAPKPAAGAQPTSTTGTSGLVTVLSALVPAGGRCGHARWRSAGWRRTAKCGPR